MNLIEAIKSGRPFKRPNTEWMVVSSKGDRFDLLDGRGQPGYYFGPDSLLADDWEIQEPEVRITRSQFWEAAEAVQVTVRAMDGYQQVSLREFLKGPSECEEHLMKLAKRLGLEGETIGK